MTDIVERLREHHKTGMAGMAHADVREAADEIERMRRDCAVDVSELYRSISRLRARVGDLEDQLLQALDERPMRREGI